MKAIPKTMKATVVEKFRQPLQIREVPVPTPGAGQALVKIMATGVCTDKLIEHTPEKLEVHVADRVLNPSVVT
jgi:D-arabinose 1-dehydrogenase-like Zn-dependent alcohol dehydrogenase